MVSQGSFHLDLFVLGFRFRQGVRVFERCIIAIDQFNRNQEVMRDESEPDTS